MKENCPVLSQNKTRDQWADWGRKRCWSAGGGGEGKREVTERERDFRRVRVPDKSHPQKIFGLNIDVNEHWTDWIPEFKTAVL